MIKITEGEYYVCSLYTLPRNFSGPGPSWVEGRIIHAGKGRSSDILWPIAIEDGSNGSGIHNFAIRDASIKEIDLYKRGIFNINDEPKDTGNFPIY